MSGSEEKKKQPKNKQKNEIRNTLKPQKNV